MGSEMCIRDSNIPEENFKLSQEVLKDIVGQELVILSNKLLLLLLLCSSQFLPQTSSPMLEMKSVVLISSGLGPKSFSSCVAPWATAVSTFLDEECRTAGCALGYVGLFHTGSQGCAMDQNSKLPGHFVILLGTFPALPGTFRIDTDT